jgi:rare lipoprotein A
MKKFILILLPIFWFSVAYGYIDTTKAVIHHSNSPDWNIQRIRQIHIKEKGFKDVGYHFLIRKSGNIEIGRPLSRNGAHAKYPIDRNNYIGICLTGYNSFTESQLKSLDKLLYILGVRDIYRHHDLCPGKGLNIEEIQEGLDSMYGGGPSYRQEGKATLYKDFKTSTGENMYLHPFAKTCASWFYPINTKLKVTNMENGKSVIVRVNDRGPDERLLVDKYRVIDLSPQAFKTIANPIKGEIPVGIDIVK